MPLRAVLACLLALCTPFVSGCRQIAAYDRAGDPDRGVVTPDGPPIDAQPIDHQAPPDTSSDLPAMPPNGVCGSPTGPWVARWTFDDLANPSSDGQVNVPFSVHGSVATTAGRCGSAAHFEGNATDYIQIMDMPAWDLPKGSIELWARFDSQPAGVPSTLLSRDAYMQEEGGHLTIAYHAGAIAARLQAETSGVAIACVYPTTVASDPKWHHIVVSFGGGKDLEIYLDGERGTYAEYALGWPCGTKPAKLRTQGLGDNGEPFIVGAGSASSATGAVGPIDNPFNGAIDELRINAVRIDYE